MNVFEKKSQPQDLNKINAFQNTASNLVGPGFVKKGPRGGKLAKVRYVCSLILSLSGIETLIFKFI